MDQPRLFSVAPDAIHLRLSYEALSGYWRVHASVVEVGRDGDAHLAPVEVYADLTSGEALDVAATVLALALGVGP